jgi:DNA-binding NarL/FixJ family response regulator
MNQTIDTSFDPQIAAIWHTTLPQGAVAHGGILILGNTGVAFQGLLKITQQCFPRLEITLARELQSNYEPDRIPQIILIEAAAFRDTPSIVSLCHDVLPGAAIALMVDDNWPDVPGLRAVVGERLVQGLLPFSMQINVWLATVWLLLNGGEYFPSAPANRAERPGEPSQAPQNALLAPAPGMTGQVPPKILSTREGQVLELMSEGLQNKLIAARMDLSEHTVKVHVHNIIRKLKVHNRTQAAAVYRSFDRRPAYGQINSAIDMARFAPSSV